jgi:hypothetical protein
MKPSAKTIHCTGSGHRLALAGILVMALASSSLAAYDLYVFPEQLDGSQGIVTLPVTVGSMADYTNNLPYNATFPSTTISASGSNGYVFSHWVFVSQPPGASISDPNSDTTAVLYTGSSDAYVMAVFKVPDVVLTIVSDEIDGISVGDPDPDDLISHTYVSGTQVNASVTSPFIFGANTNKRAVCLGYMRVGSDPDTNTVGGAITSFIIDEDTTNTWNWRTEYKLTVSEDGSGSVTVDPDQTWYTNGAVVTVTATATSPSIFSGWEGDLSGSTTPTNITMDGAKSIEANFDPPGEVSLTVISRDAFGQTVGNPNVNGAPIPGGGTQPFTGHSLINIAVDDSETYGANQDVRALHQGYTNNFGSGPASGADISTGAFYIDLDTKYTFNWQTQVLLILETTGTGEGEITRDPGGDADPDERGFWYDVGTVVNLKAVPTDSIFQRWDPSNLGVEINTTVTMTNPLYVAAIFADEPLDSDLDGLPDVWEGRFGLDLEDPTGVHGAYGDPDNDGLSNLQEYNVSQQTSSNALFEASPINADSDDDGMDDGYEYYHTLGPATTGVVGDQQNAQAVVSIDNEFGADGNLDQDFHWNTETGYELELGLTNIEEYDGPDGIVPATWPADVVPTITETVYVLVDNPADSDDQTFSDTTDSEIVGGDIIGDGFDDGFEYSWDLYQDIHGGDPTRDPLGHTIPYRIGDDALPLSAATADFNDDGELDVAVANSGLDRVAILYGQGNGVLSAPEQNLSVGATPSCVIAADLNQDGSSNDLIVANSGTNTISVILCLNDGTFDTAVEFTVGSNPSRLVAGLFDTNTTIDVAIANAVSDDVTILSGGGGAAFSEPGFSPVALPVGAAPSDIDAGPIYGAITNPVNDLVVAGFGTDQWYVLQNDGSGTFALAGSIGAGSQPSAIRIGDFGGALTGRDGTNDVTVTTFGDDRVRSYFGNGTGAFVPPAAEAEYFLGTGRGPVHFGMGDFDSETTSGAHLDLAVANQSLSPGTVGVLIGAISAAFSQGTTLLVGEAPSWVQVADMNGDGFDDLVIVERDGNTISTWWGYGVAAQFVLSAQYDTSQVIVDRRFHPRLRHVDPTDYGRRDYDLVYNPDSGGPGNWLTDDLEYDAWQDATSPLLRKEFPDRRRCSNPFLWDTDGDGLPDGWEMAFGFDPWDTNTDDDAFADGDENDDEDGFATDGTVHHHDVYLAYGYHPATAWGYDPPAPPANPNSGEFSNLEELVGPRGIPALVPNDPDDTSTHPLKQDTDGDGIWDGWEWYVNLDAQDAADGPTDNDPGDGDGLTNFEEFDSYATPPSNGVPHNGEWPNKSHPTDPWDPDTDWDQLWDGGEKAQFNFVSSNATAILNEGTGVIIYQFITGGGLNPTSVDTDGDHTPDAWEAVYGGTPGTNGLIVNGMDGTTWDNQEDWDGDGLMNYQEYMCGAIYHWQFQYNSSAPAWVPGLGLYGYEPYDFFDETLSGGGEVWTGPGGRAPHAWDPHYMIGPAYHLIPWRFMTAAEHPSGLWFSTSDPSTTDTDLDSLDDFYETYHGLNPLFGALDVVRSKVWGGNIAASWLDESDIQIVVLPVDVRRYPWIAGDPSMDVDQDQLPNIFEAIQANVEEPPYYHTDPSPLWPTDTSYEDSWVNLYYWLGNYFGNILDPYWYWDEPVIELSDLPPSYNFSFAVNEGFETDNDNLPDHAELVDEPGVSPGVTDTLESQSPMKRRALYLNGEAAARTLSTMTHNPPEFRQFTVELWARPEDPASGSDQILVERPIYVDQGNIMGLPSDLRLNFRIGVDADGLAYAGYHGAGSDLIFVEAKASPLTPLVEGEWAHLAATYGGAYTVEGYWEGELRLYINGILAQSTPSSEIPFNGWFGGLEPETNNWGYLLSAPIVVGAGDTNPVGRPHNSPIYVGPWTSDPLPVHTPPALHSYFEGWIDQVHIWDGARSQGAIKQSMFSRYTRDEIHAKIAQDPGIRYAFSFDDVPDPDHSPVAPEGFGILNGRPLGYTKIAWWGDAADRSMVYNDYRYLTWIDNLAGHARMSPPLDTTRPWSATNFYPNTSNPYTLSYEHAPGAGEERHPDLAVPLTSYGGTPTLSTNGVIFAELIGNYPDLIPLRWAEADEDVEMWDQGGLGTDPYDTDGDGMPDDWEEAHGLDPRDPTGDDGADGDLDSDDLSNLYEYLTANDPNSMDTDGDGVSDALEDFDGDHLDNRSELAELSRPDDKDTDDDGVSDWEEVTSETDALFDTTRPQTSEAPTAKTSPIDPLDPDVRRAMCFDGSARLIVPPSNKLMAEEWAVEMWVNPDGAGDGGVLISRYLTGVAVGTSGINYELGLTTNTTAGTFRPYIRYETVDAVETRLDGTGATDQTDGLAEVTIPADEWSHVAATYDLNEHLLSIYINSELAAFRTDATDVPPAVFGYATEHWGDEVTVGASRSTGAVSNGFEGTLDEVRFWRGLRSADEIADRYNAPEAIPSEFPTNAIRLKNSVFVPEAGIAAELLALPQGEPVHALVQFYSEPSSGEIAAFAGQGLQVLNYVGTGVRVATATPATLQQLSGSIRWSGLVSASDKISAKLNVNGQHASRKVLVQYHPDVAVGDALSAAQGVGATAPFGDFAMGSYMVVDASDAQIEALAQNHSVAWVSPVSAALAAGQTVRGCLHGLTAGGVTVAPFATVGDGWDGPGLGSADLGYFFENDTPDLDPTVQRDSIVAQMAKWGAVAALTFTEASSAGQDLSLDILYGSGEHGDGLPFDGPGGVLAHAFYPNDINPESIAGDLHFDEDETWTIGPGGTDHRFVALHELGHSLGLDHSDDPDAVMFPFYVGQTDDPQLHQDDIDGILSIYGAAVAALGLAEFRFDDGGETAQDFSLVEDWNNDWSSAAMLDGAMFCTNSTAPLDKDSDLDGMPDWWEIAYGLSPYIGLSGDGPYGDPDADALHNLGEYLAGTDPKVADTDDDGLSDFFGWFAGTFRIFGEIFTDFDGMDDIWELDNGLDPRQYDAHLDMDDDGWSNLGEAKGNTDPNDSDLYPIPAATFRLRYDGIVVGVPVILAYSSASMDGEPNGVYDLSALPTVPVSGEVVGLSGAAAYNIDLAYENLVPGSLSIGDITHSFLDSGQGTLFGSLAGSAGTVDYTAGTVLLTYTNLAAAGNTMTADYRYREDELVYPMTLTFTSTVEGYLREGDNWFFAFIDSNADAVWQEGEPAGNAIGQPIVVDWSVAGPIDIALTDGIPGYGRFSWTPNTEVGEYRVRVVNLSLGGAPVISPFPLVKAPRTWFHEQDYRDGGITGLTHASYAWTVYEVANGVDTEIASGAFSTDYAPSMSVPVPVWPVGAEWTYAQNELRWTQDDDCTEFEIEIARDIAFTNVIFSQRDVAPAPYAGDGTTRHTLPIYAGDDLMTNGVYYWHVRTFNGRFPAGSAYSSPGSMTVNLVDYGSGPFSISGDVGYFGKVTNSHFVVQAFASPGFGYVPAAQMTISNTSDAVGWPQNELPFTLSGLHAGSYYVRSFLDQDGDKKKADWESSGFVQITAYTPESLSVPVSVTDKWLPVWLADTDNDDIADDWEYQYLGELLTMGPGLYNGYTDQTPGGLNDFESYAATPMNANPFDADAAGADGIPFWVKIAFNMDIYTYYAFTVMTVGKDADDHSVVRWPAPQGTGIQVLDNGMAHVSNNGVTLSYTLQYSQNLITWSDLPGDAPVTYDPVAGEFEVIDASQTNRMGFYRVLMGCTQ